MEAGLNSNIVLIKNIERRRKIPPQVAQSIITDWDFLIRVEKQLNHFTNWNFPQTFCSAIRIASDTNQTDIIRWENKTFKRRKLPNTALNAGCHRTPAVSPHLGNVLGVDAVDGVPDVLPGGDEEGECQTGHDCDGVVEPEDTAVYLDMREFYQTLQSSQ